MSFTSYSFRFADRGKRKEVRGCFFVCTNLSSLVLFFCLSYIFRLVFFCWFFLPHFFVTLLHTKSAALEETTRLFRPHVLNGQPTLDERAESAGARPPPPPSPWFFFVRERARALLFFLTRRRDVLSQRSRYYDSQKTHTKRFLSPRLKIMHTHTLRAL